LSGPNQAASPMDRRMIHPRTTRPYALLRFKGHLQPGEVHDDRRHITDLGRAGAWLRTVRKDGTKQLAVDGGVGVADQV
jgi:hypothetical protein